MDKALLGSSEISYRGPLRARSKGGSSLEGAGKGHLAGRACVSHT